MSEPTRIEPGEVAFELAGPGGAVVVVPVTINGRGPYDFALDTGATFTCVDQQLAAELELPEETSHVGFGAGVMGQGAVKIVRVDAFAVGPARGDELLAAVIDLGSLRDAGVEIRGLVGLNFLKAFRVTLDFEREVLRLDAPGAA